MDTLETRFWSKVKNGHPNECWEWQASLDRDGYGHFGIKGKSQQAHRVAWMLSRKENPGKLCVLHTCDNRKCVNPNHLYLGGQKENARDREVRNRSNHPTGEKHWKAKHSDEVVAQIRRLGGTMTQQKIADMFGTSQTYVSEILKGEAR